MTLVQANLRKIRDESALCAQRFSLDILLQVNLRLRACLPMCLKYGRYQPQRAYKARAYIKKKCKGKNIWVNMQIDSSMDNNSW